MEAEATDWVACIRSAVTGDELATRKLVRFLTPFIQVEATRALLRGPLARSGPVRAEVEELSQEVLGLLFARRGRVLLRWDPERGASLPGFIRLIARRHVLRKLRAHSDAGHFVAALATDTDLDASSAALPALEAEVITRDLLAKILRRLGEELTTKGAEMFRLLFVEQRPIEEIEQATALSAEAIYKWRSRLREQVERAARQMGAPALRRTSPPQRRAKARDA